MNSESLARKITALGITRRYKKNAFLFQAQEDASGFFYILTGGVRIFKMDENGREVEVVRLGPGDFLAEAIALASAKFPGFAQATEDSQVIFIETRGFFKKLEADAELSKFFLILLARKCLILNERIESLGLRTVRQRLIQYLLSQCSGENVCLVELEIKKSDLAKLLGTISATLSRNLREMQHEGLIEVRGKQIRIQNCLKMRHELSS
jgi:CRP/FNR family transcriptional regulator, dissimilatory nitrate respiration regulator